jgi:hypothetical protein
VSGPETGLLTDIRVEDLAKQLDLDPADLRTALPKRILPRQIPGFYFYSEGYAFHTQEKIERFLGSISRSA